MAIKKCTCKSTFQDKLHGKGKRVHNELAHNKGLRCTVCKEVKT